MKQNTLSILLEAYIITILVHEKNTIYIKFLSKENKSSIFSISFDRLICNNLSVVVVYNY